MDALPESRYFGGWYAESLASRGTKSAEARALGVSLPTLLRWTAPDVDPRLSTAALILRNAGMRLAIVPDGEPLPEGSVYVEPVRKALGGPKRG